MEFQSTRPVWGATSRTDCIAPCSSTISIHAPRVGRDLPGNALKELGWEFQSTRPVWGATIVYDRSSATEDISIHAPRVGRDAARDDGHSRADAFQSTRPVWGATSALPLMVAAKGDFNPRAPCGARLGKTVGGVTYYNISIHAPRVGRD